MHEQNRWSNRKIVCMVAGVILLRYISHSIMLFLTLINEIYPASRSSDVVWIYVPYMSWIDKYNYFLWLWAFIPVAIWLLITDHKTFVRFAIVGSLLSVIRGICILCTNFGPIASHWQHDPNAGKSFEWICESWWGLVNPFSALFTDIAHVSLTKDMFFSGHVASTFLLYLYCRNYKKISMYALIAHIFVVFVVLLSHLHYSWDIIGAWIISYLVYRVLDPKLHQHYLFREPHENFSYR